MSDDGMREKQWSGEQRERAIALLEQIPWGDMDGAIRVFEAILRLVLETTREDFRRCEEHIAPELEAGGVDECSLPPDMLDAWSDKDKLAHVARLLRSLALTYGVSAEFGPDRAGWSAKSTTTRRRLSFGTSTTSTCCR
jgi:hypothetical protein